MATSTTALGRVRATRAGRIAAPIVISALLVGGLSIASAPASAEPTKTIEQVQAEVDALEHDAADAAEAWNEARLRQTTIETKIAKLKKRIAAAEKAYGQVASAVDAMARAAYASGGIEPSLQALLADDPEAFLEQSAALDQVARAQGTSLRRTQNARLRLAQLQAELAQQESQAKAAAADAKKSKDLVSSKLAQAQKILAGLKAEERKRLEALQARQRQASAAAAARAAAANEASRDRSDNGNDGGSTGGSNGGGVSNNASGRARIAVAYALAQVGDRYVAAASGPSAFDCSGLTMAAWRQAGVSLPHLSYAQWDVTRRVSRSELRPGDLVFYFGGGAHHVSMYVGGGMMVSASNPRDGVELIAAWGPWYGERYSGAGRVA
ncbi:MAG: C40 family peptidase [Actinobacteria bacterium]|nr:C40 family peptidase [Actinomycetota bacterium]